MHSALRRNWTDYLLSVLATVCATSVLVLLRQYLNHTTVALCLLLIVLLVATRFRSGPAVTSAVLGMLCFNFFFLPPIQTFNIADLENWVALCAFLITALVAGQLSARARQRAEE
ncbi:MAG: DUF4118 domain-containing protein, partial [Pyrinomonadaceae bacterium]|nr:DUF4118 domain-containing protein [Pyrinomonadaceae bacterium]